MPAQTSITLLINARKLININSIDRKTSGARRNRSFYLS
jgi:hypothetical protein